MKLATMMMSRREATLAVQGQGSGPEACKKGTGSWDMRVTTAAVRHSVMTFQANNSSREERALGGILCLFIVLQMIFGHCLDQMRLYGGVRL